MFQQIIRISADNSNKQLESLAEISNNIANMNTTAYKVGRFEQYLRPDGSIDGVVRKDMSQGPVMITRRELDVAIEGDGYLPVTEPDGRVAYTRDGSLGINAEGYLVTNRGDLVGDGIQVPLNYEKIRIYPDGKVEMLRKGDLAPRELGRLSLVTFRNPEGLEGVGHNKVIPTEESGPALKPEKPGEFKQGCLERANFSIYHQIDGVLRLNAGLIANYRIIKFSDDLYRQATNLKQ